VAHLREILPCRAKDIAFMNSVVFGTRANRVTPRNFSSIPEPSRTTSTTLTRISAEMSKIVVYVFDD
jgi:hypothetical protein